MMNSLGELAHGLSDSVVVLVGCFLFHFCFVFVWLFFLGLGEETVRRKQVCDWLAQSLFQSQCGCLSS